MLKNKKYKYLTLIIFSILLFTFVNGQKQPDSLSVYFEIAAKNNPTVVQYFYEYQAALEKVPQVGSLPEPELSIGYFLKPME
ncbi:MAG: transporter, partial [Bacteroidetes bacterium]|nr:transporter [Bacteroidota bacterium]